MVLGKAADTFSMAHGFPPERLHAVSGGWPGRGFKRADEPEAVSPLNSFILDLIQGKSEELPLISRSRSF